MKRFSQRIGATETPSIIQLESISDVLRNTLWNFIFSIYDKGDEDWWHLGELTAMFFFKTAADELPYENWERRKWLKKHFYTMPWYEVYDYCEFIVRTYDSPKLPHPYKKEDIPVIFNGILEQELSGYRFVANELVPISNPAEVAEIESALSTTSASGLAGAHAHISAALSLLAKRPDPDFRNSIKESISAVEALAKQLGSQESQGLAGALTELGKKVPIHGGLRAGLLSLYGYTSDQGGIRHAMLDEPNLTYDDAKYMAVACSAFVNYLAAKAQSAGLLASKK
jgi:hypothetical protein